MRSASAIRNIGCMAITGEHPTHDDDLGLVARIGERDAAALAVLYDRYGRRVRTTAAGILRDGAAAEDLAQEVFLSLWLRPGRFDPARGSLLTFLLTMTRARAVDVLRAEGARARRQHRHVTQPASEAAAVADVADVAVQATSAGDVRRALDRLSGPERTAITLAYFGNLSYCEVASRLNLPEGTVKSRIRSGLRRLRESADPTLLSLLAA